MLDPYASNPAFHSVFENYTLWRNNECGFLAEDLGYTTLKDFKIADSKKGGVQIHKTNLTKEFVILENALIVGISKGNSPSDPSVYFKDGRGIIAPRTDGFKVDGADFYNFN